VVLRKRAKDFEYLTSTNIIIVKPVINIITTFKFTGGYSET
jgi:hypothetical protein